MFGIFSKNSENADKYDPNEVTTEYSGEAICADFGAYQTNRDTVDVNDDTVPQVLHPHGKGKITFKFKGEVIEEYKSEVIEEYKGEFEVGFYNGKGTLTFPKGKLTDEPEMYKGQFEMWKYIGK